MTKATEVGHRKHRSFARYRPKEAAQSLLISLVFTRLATRFPQRHLWLANNSQHPDYRKSSFSQCQSTENTLPTKIHLPNLQVTLRNTQLPSSPSAGGSCIPAQYIQAPGWCSGFWIGISLRFHNWKWNETGLENVWGDEGERKFH